MFEYDAQLPYRRNKLLPLYPNWDVLAKDCFVSFLTQGKLFNL